MKKCLYCAEEIQDEAIKCKHCGELLNAQTKEYLVVCPKCNKKTNTELPYICKICKEPLPMELVRKARKDALLEVEKEKSTGELLGIKNTIFKGMVKCPYCHKVIKPQGQEANVGGCLITIILLCFFLIPGIIYMIWHSSKKQCPECKMAL